MHKNYYTYILASKKDGVLYIGITDNLEKRTWQHKQSLVEGFTKKYGVHYLVYFEIFDKPEDAIYREKRLKKWNRAWKIRLIEEKNPDWDDISEKIK